jgi:DnaJ like chaperone protein
MAKFSKWIAGGLGWALGGPIGGLIGFAIGSLLDEATINPDVRNLPPPNGQTPPTGAGDFSVSLLVLTAAVMKADGRVVRAELDYVKSFYVSQFGVERTRERMLILREIVNKEIPVNDVCNQIRFYMDYDARVQLLHMLFGLAASDGAVEKSEVSILQLIGRLTGISHEDFQSISAMFIRSASWAFQVLEVDPEASDEELKKAYRKMALKYHPDRVSHLGEEYQKDANAKFQKVNEAWEEIKKARGIS